MPYSIRKLSKPVKNTKGQLAKWAVVKKDTGEVVGKCSSHQEAIKMIGALHANAD